MKVVLQPFWAVTGARLHLVEQNLAITMRIKVSMVYGGLLTNSLLQLPGVVTFITFPVK